MRALREQEGVVDAAVLDASGRVLADGRDGRRTRAAGPEDARAAAATSLTVAERDGVLEALQPLSLGDERVGTLVVSLSASRSRGRSPARATATCSRGWSLPSPGSCSRGCSCAGSRGGSSS